MLKKLKLTKELKEKIALYIHNYEVKTTGIYHFPGATATAENIKIEGDKVIADVTLQYHDGEASFNTVYHDCTYPLDKVLGIKDIKKYVRRISREIPYVNIKPYSHNIISLCLQAISQEFGKDKANEIIRKYGLKKLGWHEEK